MTQTTPETATETAALHALLDQLSAAWAENDAKKFAELFAPEGTVVEGAAVEGPLLPLLLAMCGREAALDALSGAGVAELRRRL